MKSIEKAIDSFEPVFPVAVAFSGGADSTALLLACARKWPGNVRAIHVHHGLQDAADGFVEHCVSFCGAMDVPLAIRRVDARPKKGQSPEGSARSARYGALTEAARDAWPELKIATIVLGHHADDQVETLLLAMSRGSGLPGMSAMPMLSEKLGLLWARPFLNVSGIDIRSWLKSERIEWLEDPTNTDEKYTRNRIRSKLMPILGQAFPAFRATFCRSAAHAAQAQELLEEVARDDLQAIGLSPSIEALQRLSSNRMTNVLRYWLASTNSTHASSVQMSELKRQILNCKTRGHQISLKIGSGFLTARKGRLEFGAHCPQVKNKVPSEAVTGSDHGFSPEERLQGTEMVLVTGILGVCLMAFSAALFKSLVFLGMA